MNMMYTGVHHLKPLLRCRNVIQRRYVHAFVRHVPVVVIKDVFLKYGKNSVYLAYSVMIFVRYDWDDEIK